MAIERVADLSMDDLRVMIDRVVERRLQEILKPVAPRVREILDLIDLHRWMPPPGTPSTRELLRENRDT